MLKQQLEQDIKTALLGGDKDRAITLRGLKSVILYAEVEKGKREEGLSDQEIIALFAKEAKKRQESADLYRQGGNEAAATAELNEKTLIEGYLPQQLSEDELGQIIDEVISELTEKTPQAMGKVIGQVKQRTEGAADGNRIAQMVKERLAN
jgi:uncharacterized protein YqeY